MCVCGGGEWCFTGSREQKQIHLNSSKKFLWENIISNLSLGFQTITSISDMKKTLTWVELWVFCVVFFFPQLFQFV